MPADVAILGSDDEPELLAYLDAHPDPTMFIRFAWSAGGARFAALRGEAGIGGVAVQNKNGAVLVHSSGGQIPALAQACLHSPDGITGVGGPHEEVREAIAALGLGGRKVQREGREVIMALDLDKLVLPDLLSQPGIVVRRATPADLPLLKEWRIRYYNEVFRLTPDAELLSEVEAAQRDGRLWVLEDDGKIVNTAAWYAVYPRLVQVEYAYSPAELRSKHYGRSAVAGGLAVMREEGVRRGVFHTGEKNMAVQIGIDPIGFKITHRHLFVQFA